MRFILSFFFFGFLFFLIWVFFPEAFYTLVSWAQAVYDFLKHLYEMAADTFRSKETTSSSQTGLVGF